MHAPRRTRTRGEGEGSAQLYCLHLIRPVHSAAKAAWQVMVQRTAGSLLAFNMRQKLILNVVQQCLTPIQGCSTAAD